jgi:hypothetical protein
MTNGTSAIILFAVLLGPTAALAAGGKITISTPMDGAMVAAGEKFKLSYEARPGQDDHHLHFNVDGERMDILRQLKGTVEVDGLTPGKHQLCLLMNTRGHVPSGTESCVNVEAK